MEHPDDAYLMARATRWMSDDPFPGLVEVQFSERDGTVITIHEKAPVIAPGDRCRSDAAYPQEVALACRILDATTATYTVRIKHGVEDIGGRDVFVVRYEDVLLCRYDEADPADGAPPGPGPALGVHHGWQAAVMAVCAAVSGASSTPGPAYPRPCWSGISRTGRRLAGRSHWTRIRPWSDAVVRCA